MTRQQLQALAFLFSLVLLAVSACAPAAAPTDAPEPAAGANADIPYPADVFGFEPGTDYELADNSQLQEYYEQLAAASERVELVEIGTSTQGRPMLLLYISSEENLGQLDRWRETSARLARARDLTDEEARALAREGKAIVWIDAGLHSTEVAHAQHAPLLAYHMATDESDETRRIRDDVVLLLMPVMNPDGQDIVVDWYREQLGTDFETTSTPWLYSEYTGHDNNRDWFMIRQQETEVVTRQLYHEWYPQIIFNHHQTAPFPARIFIPPFADPVNPHIPPLVVRGVNLVGDHMAHRFEAENMPGVVSRMAFTMWWNGGMRTAPYFHNMIGILSEVGHASATPQEHDPDDFPETFGRGSAIIPTLEPSVFYTNPWRGGRASLGDAVKYHMTASLGTLDVAQKNKQDFLYNIYQMGRDAIRAGEEGGPFAYVVPVDESQWDSSEAIEMLNVLRRGGLEVHRATAEFQAGGEMHPAGSYLLYAGQAFRPHLLDMMEPQEHPHREIYPGGPPEPPYGGLAGYTLPIQMGVHAVRVDEPFDVQVEEVDEARPDAGEVSGEAGFGYALSPRENASAVAVNRLLENDVSLYRAGSAFQAGGREHDAGTVVVETGGGSTGQVEALAEELGLDFRGIGARPGVELAPLGEHRIGLYKSWVANMDEGWTRWLMHHFEFPVDTITDQDVRAGDLSDYDVIILPSQSASAMLDGHEPGNRPEPYTGGLGTEGVAALSAFVDGGGRILAFDAATDFTVEHFDLPVANTLADLDEEDFFIPGSLIRVTVDNEHPVAFGMQPEAAAFFQGSRAFRASDPARVEVVASYAADDLLMSGWEVGAAEHLAGHAAVVRVEHGAGDVVLIGFRPQFRAQPAGTFKLIFNALYGAASD